MATPVLLPGKFHGQRSLAGYSPKGRRKSGVTGHTCPRKGESSNNMGIQ